MRKAFQVKIQCPQAARVSPPDFTNQGSVPVDDRCYGAAVREQIRGSEVTMD